jgi:pimeloyl-ACP methyl ester carboxylesterase
MNAAPGLSHASAHHSPQDEGAPSSAPRAAPVRRFMSMGAPLAASGQARRMSYLEWEGTDSADPGRVVICVHGLSRQAHDFDTLAAALVAQARVVAVDVAGRGHSDWLSDPMAYQLATYVADFALLVQTLRKENPDLKIDWVGTSMGGLIGIALAAQPALALRRLVLNDVGPALSWAALQRIGSYLGLDPTFESEQAAFDYLASISAGFGPHSAAQWQVLSRPMLREREGRWHLHHDPAIAIPFKALVNAGDSAAARQSVADGEALLWHLYDAITAPTLLLRGSLSDLLNPETALAMTQRGPRARCVEVAGVGHAPTLVAPDQVAVVCDFLGRVDP